MCNTFEGCQYTRLEFCIADIQKPNVMLATKNTGKWMVLSTSARIKNEGVE